LKNFPLNTAINTLLALKIAAAVPVSPMAVNKDIEATRGSEQTWGWGGRAVYKSGTEWNGVLDPEANNIGLANIADLDKGQVPGQIVPLTLSGFFSGNEGGIISLSCNYLVPGCNDMSLTHDNWGGSQIVKNIPLGLQFSIIPAYPYNTYGLIGKPVNQAIDYLTTITTDQNKTKERE
jgi:hypothetical protein